MDHNDKRAIEGLFDRLQTAARTAPARDPEAEALIRQSMARQEGSDYYLAQTVVVQDQALEAAQARIEGLEYQLNQARQSQGGGLFSRLFGGGAAPAPRAAQHAAMGMGGRQMPQQMQQQAPQGGGFLAGAAQTAVGVAGGMMLGNMLASAFSSPAEAAPAEYSPLEEPSSEESYDDSGDFDMGDDW